MSLVTPTIDLEKGVLLAATPLLEDANFHRSVVLLLEHNSEGSLGVILNRPIAVDSSLLHALPAWADDINEESQFFGGGPVQPNALLALAPTSDSLRGGTPLNESIALLDLEATSDLRGSALVNVRFYFGYSGWSPGQLAMEIEEGAWWTFKSRTEDLFAEPHDCWREVLARQSSAARLLAVCPDQPFMN